MKLYIGVNKDGSCIISKQKLKRYIDYSTNIKDVLSFEDMKMGPHWMLDYEGIEVPKTGDMPVNVYLTLPKNSLKTMFNVDMTWEDDYKEIEL